MQELIKETIAAVRNHLEEQDYPEAAGMLGSLIYKHQPTGRGRIFEAQLNGLVEDARARRARDRHFEEITGVSSVRRSTRITHVISLSPADENSADSGVFAIGVAEGASDEVRWTTVVRGRTDHAYFGDSRYAVLHALAQDTAVMDRGRKSDQGATAAFAGRVLGFLPDSE